MTVNVKEPQRLAARGDPLLSYPRGRARLAASRRRLVEHLKSQGCGQREIARRIGVSETFGLTADLWQGHVEKEVGQKYGKLLQLYGVHKATMEARKKGLSVMRRQQQNGSVKLVLMGV